MGRRVARVRTCQSQTKGAVPSGTRQSDNPRSLPCESMLHDSVGASPETHPQTTEKCLSIVSPIVRGDPGGQRGKEQAQGRTASRRVAEAGSPRSRGHPSCLTFLWCGRTAKWSRGDRGEMGWT